MNYTAEEIKGFEAQRKLLAEKLNRLKLSWSVQTDEARRFELEYEITRLEAELDEVKKCLAEAYDLGSPSGQERLREKIRQLHISEDMGRLHLVNCNRQELRDRFAAAFDAHQEQGRRNHYYFLSACPKQLPPSLGERMLYELLGELLDEDSKQSVHCRFDVKHNDRVRLAKLPLDYSLEKSKKAFREFCEGWFDWNEHQEMEQAFAGNLLPLPRYQYSILPFTLRKRDYKSFFPEYFDWIAEQLANRPANGPVLLVFFVFYLDELHLQYEPESQKVSEPKAAEMIDAINGLCAKHPEAGHFYPLYPVEKADLQYWFEDLGEHNPARLEPLFQTLAESLPAPEAEQYRQKQLLNMDRIELVQELVFHLYNQ